MKLKPSHLLVLVFMVNACGSEVVAPGDGLTPDTNGNNHQTASDPIPAEKPTPLPSPSPTPAPGGGDGPPEELE